MEYNIIKIPEEINDALQILNETEKSREQEKIEL